MQFPTTNAPISGWKRFWADIFPRGPVRTVHTRDLLKEVTGLYINDHYFDNHGVVDGAVDELVFCDQTLRIRIIPHQTVELRNELDFFFYTVEGHRLQGRLLKKAR